MGGILRDNLGEGNCESKIAARQWGVNFCREASRCLAGPSGHYQPTFSEKGPLRKGAVRNRRPAPSNHRGPPRSKDQEWSKDKDWSKDEDWSNPKNLFGLFLTFRVISILQGNFWRPSEKTL